MKSSSGVIKYILIAFFFVLSAGITAKAYSAKNYLMLIIYSVLLSIVALKLGGRGFVVIMMVAFIFRITKDKQVSIVMFLMSLAFIFVTASFLDLLILLLRHGKLEFIKFEMLDYAEIYIKTRGFNALQNFYLVYTHYQVLDVGLEPVLKGYNDTFMEKFFPVVHFRGYGFPMGVLAEFFVAAGYLGLCIGGLLLGYIARVLFYFNSKYDTAIVDVYTIVIAFYTLPIGRNFFDNFMKMSVYVVFSDELLLLMMRKIH